VKIFVATSYSSKVNYDTGEVFPDYKEWLEGILSSVEQAGHEPFCALRKDWYKINTSKPAEAFRLDLDNIKSSYAMLVLLDDHVSAGVQAEIGIAAALGKKLILAHAPEHKLVYFNDAMIQAGVAKELTLPLDTEKLNQALAD
jgi:hypothetical protein